MSICYILKHGNNKNKIKIPFIPGLTLLSYLQHHVGGDRPRSPDPPAPPPCPAPSQHPPPRTTPGHHT